MRTKALLTVGVLCLISLLAIGQQSRRDYTREGVLAQEQGSYYFSIGKKNKEGNLYDSVFSWYTKTGKLKSVEFRDVQGNPIGNYKTFYDNGKPKAAGRYEHKGFKIYQTSPDSIERTIIEFRDSTGRVQVRKGYGRVNGRIDYLRERGRIENDLRDSVWTCWYDNGRIFYQESWHEGELVDGISYNAQGVEFYYKKMYTDPEPVEGLSAFYEKISDWIQYPKEAEQRGIEGKVIIEFEVSADGVIHSPKVVRGMPYGCDEEALRVLKLSPPWKPALHRGQPVPFSSRITYVFKLT